VGVGESVGVGSSDGVGSSVDDGFSVFEEGSSVGDGSLLDVASSLNVGSSLADGSSPVIPAVSGGSENKVKEFVFPCPQAARTMKDIKTASPGQRNLFTFVRVRRVLIGDFSR